MFAFPQFTLLCALGSLAAGSAFAQAAATAVAAQTEFTAHLDSYHMVPGYSSTTTADFKISVVNNTAMVFSVTPHNHAQLSTVSLFQGQLFVGASDGPPELYVVCGEHSNDPRPTCNPNGYSGAPLVASDILPYGQSKDISVLIDLMRRNLVFIAATLTDGSNYMTIRGQLTPVTTP